LSLFFGEGLSSPRVVSYAASFGNHDAEAGLDGHRADQLRKFDAISVRDQNSRDLIEAALGQESALVLDPCLQFPPRVAEGVPNPETAREPFALVYGHGFPDWFIDSATRWAQSRRLRLVSVGYRNGWTHRHRLDAGPLEFALLAARSAAVLTNFFHGCVFALLNGKPFACTASAYRANKLRDLTRLLEAEQHLLRAPVPQKQFAALLDVPLAAQVQAAITTGRRRSETFLQSVLG
jgi:hypothetical protein